MSYERKMLVRKAFNCLDKDGSGVATIDDILSCYDTTTHPDVAGGNKTPQQAAEEMLATFEQGGKVDGQVTWPEFLDYYKGLSVGIDDDNYFELMMRNAWHLSGGEGSSANSTCRRVLVVHGDGSQEVVEIKDDLGVGKFDVDKISKLLMSQGVRDIANIKF
jgi:calcyphosin